MNHPAQQNHFFAAHHATTTATTNGWFAGAPWTKCISLTVLLVFVVMRSQQTHYLHDHQHHHQHHHAQKSSLLAVDYRKILQGETHRWITGKLTFGTTGELVMGGFLLAMLLRKFEREMGSRKFIAFLFYVNLLEILLEWIVAHVIWGSDDVHYTGPYPTLGAVFWLYHVFTPRLYPNLFGILGFHFSEKTLVYAISAQVMYSGRWNTMLPSLCGMAVSALMIRGWLIPVDYWTVPEPLAKVGLSISERLQEDPPILIAPRRPGGVATAQQQQQQQRMVPTHPLFQNLPAQQAPDPWFARTPTPPAAAAAAAPSPPPPPEAAVEQLTAMGFDRARVLDALRSSQNNIERAADRLLSGE